MNAILINLAGAPMAAPAYASPVGSIAQLLVVVLSLVSFLIFIRAILSWFMPVGRDPLTRLLVDVTEPILAPARQILGRMMPGMGGMDFSPLVVLLLIQFVLIPLLSSIR